MRLFGFVAAILVLSSMAWAQLDIYSKVTLGDYSKGKLHDDYVLLSNSAKEWGEGQHIPLGTKVRIIDRWEFDYPADRSHNFWRYKVEGSVRGRPFKGWVHDFNVKVEGK